MKSEQELLTPKEVAKWLDVSVDWVQDHAIRKNPRLPVVRIGKLVDRAHDFAEALAIESRRSPLFARPIRNVNYRGNGMVQVIEKHYTINDLTGLLNMSFERARQLVKDEPGVLRHP